MNKPSRRFSQATRFIHPNLRDVVLAGAVARRRTEPVEVVESLWGRMSEGERQVEGLFESLLSQSFSS